LKIPSFPASALAGDALVKYLRSRAEAGKELLYLEIGSVFPFERRYVSSLEKHVTALRYTESV